MSGVLRSMPEGSTGGNITMTKDQINLKYDLEGRDSAIESLSKLEREYAQCLRWMQILQERMNEEKRIISDYEKSIRENPEFSVNSNKTKIKCQNN